MAIFAEQRRLGQQVGVARQRAGKIHQLTQPQHARLAHQRAQRLGVKHPRRALEGRRRHARRQLHMDLQRHLARPAQHQANPLKPQHVGNLMRIDNRLVVPRTRTARANSGTESIVLSMCT